MTDAGLLADLDRALTATEPVVMAARADQWAAPTPCAELDVRGVLNHLVSGNLLSLRSSVAGRCPIAAGTTSAATPLQHSGGPEPDILVFERRVCGCVEVDKKPHQTSPRPEWLPPVATIGHRSRGPGTTMRHRSRL